MYNSGNSSKNVTGASIVDGTVETVDIADDAVTADKLANSVNTDIATGVSGSTTAGDALPKAGGAMTGAITTNSTFDGRDVATDGAALDVLDLAINSAADSVAITIDSSENVGIGITSPNERLSVVAEDDASPADNGFSIYRSVGDDKVTINCQGGAAKFIADGGSAHMASIFYSYNGSTLSEHLRVEATGDVKVPIGNLVIGTSGKGIDFSATSDGSGTMTSEVLDDYEEGYWTAGLTANVGTITINAAKDQGSYTKVGRLVTVQGAFRVSAISTPSGDFRITGLPYTPTALNESAEGFSANVGVSATASNVTGLIHCISEGGTSILVREGFGTTANLATLANKIDTGTYIYVSATYYSE